MYRMVVWLLGPYNLLFLAVGLAIVNLWRRRREGRGRLLLVTVPFAGLVLFSHPLASHLAIGSLEWRHPPARVSPSEADAIVVLAGAIRPADAWRPRAELGPDTIYRCLHAAEIYRRGGPIPILVSGGRVRPTDPDPTAAQLMREFLVDHGVRPGDLIEEGESRTTFENAARSRDLLRRRGLGRIILVTDAIHLERAARCFRKQGLAVVPSGCHYLATPLEPSLGLLLPSPGAAQGCQAALHEWLGLAWYRLHGRI